MPDLKQLELALTEKLGLKRRPVAVLFCDASPAGVEKFEGTVPSGCTFWSLAAAGRTFYTVPSDHYNCPIGSYTHHIDLPEARQAELGGTLQLMSDIGYVKMEEVPGIPRLAETPAAIVYGPLGDCPGEPDVVLVAGQPSKVMLLIETATRAGVPYTAPTLARPTCMAVPAAMGGSMVTSTGCVGNRVYTNIGDDDFYAVLRGSDVEPVVAELDTITSANAKLREYHEARRGQLTS